MWQYIRRFGIELYCFFTAPLFVKNPLGMLVLYQHFSASLFWWISAIPTTAKHGGPQLYW